MKERDAFKAISYIEINPKDTRVWRGRNMKPFDLTGCNRFFIYHGLLKGGSPPRSHRDYKKYIEFQYEDGTTRTYRLDKEIFFLENNYFPPHEDRLVPTHNWINWPISRVLTIDSSFN